MRLDHLPSENIQNRDLNLVQKCIIWNLLNNLTGIIALGPIFLLNLSEILKCAQFHRLHNPLSLLTSEKSHIIWIFFFFQMEYVFIWHENINNFTGNSSSFMISSIFICQANRTFANGFFSLYLTKYVKCASITKWFKSNREIIRNWSKIHQNCRILKTFGGEFSFLSFRCDEGGMNEGL